MYSPWDSFTRFFFRSMILIVPLGRICPISPETKVKRNMLAGMSFGQNTEKRRTYLCETSHLWWLVRWVGGFYGTRWKWSGRAGKSHPEEGQREGYSPSRGLPLIEARCRPTQNPPSRACSSRPGTHTSLVHTSPSILIEFTQLQYTFNMDTTGILFIYRSLGPQMHNKWRARTLRSRSSMERLPIL